MELGPYAPYIYSIVIILFPLGLVYVRVRKIETLVKDLIKNQVVSKGEE